jgi:5-methylcytosine-specific restriction endonuclease McrA
LLDCLCNSVVETTRAKFRVETSLSCHPHTFTPPALIGTENLHVILQVNTQCSSHAARVHRLTGVERETILDVVLHIAELDRRRLYLNLGYATLFDYCTRQLKYSASAAGRRIQAARCIRRFPSVIELLRTGRVNLCTLSLVAGVLSEENHEKLLTQIRERSYREVEAIVSSYRPRPVMRDRIKTVSVVVPGPVTPKRVEPASTPNVGSDTTRCKKISKPHIEKRVLIQFSADPAFMQKLEEAKSLLSHKLGPNASLEEIFDAALETFLDKHSPKRREERRKQRQNQAARRSSNPRQISKPIRDQVFQRDRSQCAYVSAAGKRCSATRMLQIDHIVPVARGGTNAPSNLRLLCAAHNKLEAERVLGSASMGKYRRRE